MPSKTLSFYKATYVALFVLALGTFTSVSFTALSHVLLIVAGPYFLITSSRNYINQMPKSFWLLVGLAAVCILSVIVNADIISSPLKNIIKTKYFIIGALSTFAFKELIDHYLEKKHIRFLIHLFLIATTVATVSGLIGLWFGFNPLKMKNACHATRACGLYGMYMTYGYGISLFMVILTTVVFYRKKFQEWIDLRIVYIAWIINMLGLIFSFARGGWLGFLMAIPFIVLKESRKLFILICLSSVIVFSAAFFLSDKVHDVFTKRTGSNQQRIAFYKTAIKAVQEKPMFGWGYRNFEPNVKKLKAKYDIEYKDLGGHAHNNLFEHLASTGLIGFTLVLALMLFWLWESFVRDDLVATIVFPFFMSFFISGMTQYTFGDGENLFLLMGVVAIFYATSLPSSFQLQRSSASLK